MMEELINNTTDKELIETIKKYSVKFIISKTSATFNQYLDGVIFGLEAIGLIDDIDNIKNLMKHLNCLKIDYKLDPFGCLVTIIY